MDAVDLDCGNIFFPMISSVCGEESGEVGREEESNRLVAQSQRRRQLCVQ